MGLFDIFKKNTKPNVLHGFYEVNISHIEELTARCIKIVFNIPEEMKNEFKFKPGQFVEILLFIESTEERRSYSICSGTDEPLAIAVKEIEDGYVSKFLNEEIKIGDKLFISKPHGNFTLDDNAKNIVAIAAGSGITPIISIAKEIEKREGNVRLFYGNRTKNDIIFRKELKHLKHTFVFHYLSAEHIEGYEKGRIDKSSFTNEIKNDLSLLRADAFYVCGPEQMIFDVVTTLKFFGVAESKIHFELFSPSDLFESKVPTTENEFKGKTKVSVILDGEKTNFEMSASAKDLLRACEDEGIDAPYNCRGAVCSSCRAKVLKGSATMTKNYTLTDQEIADGYILTCQAHPTSEELTISFDE